MIRPSARAILWIGVAVAAAGCSRFNPEPQPERFEILGAHAELTCEFRVTLRLVDPGHRLHTRGPQREVERGDPGLGRRFHTGRD